MEEVTELEGTGAGFKELGDVTTVSDGMGEGTELEGTVVRVAGGVALGSG